MDSEEYDEDVINQNIVVSEAPTSEECDDNESEGLSTPSVSFSSSSSNNEDDDPNDYSKIERIAGRIAKYLFDTFNYPYKLSNLLSHAQMITLILIAISYNAVLRTENRTFGWRAVLSIFGLQVNIKEIVPGRPFYGCRYHSIEHALEEGIIRHFPHTPQCDYYISGLRNLLGHFFIVGGASIFNIVFIYWGKSTMNYNLKLAHTISIFYPVVSLYFLSHIIMELSESWHSLQDDMDYELKKVVLPNTISAWWRNTQILSECCGGAGGPTDWKMDKYEPSANIYYHRSCLRNDETTEMVAEPQLIHLWEVGCIEKEQAKLLKLGVYISALMYFQGVLGTCLLLEIIKKRIESNNFFTWIGFEFESEKLMKVRVIIHGEDLHPVIVNMAEDNIIARVNSVLTIEKFTIQKMPSICDRLFYSKCIICLLRDKKKFSEVVIIGAKALIMAIRIEKHRNYVKLIYDKTKRC